MELTTVWFAVIAFLWIGYFVLEGFDFGVGILLPLIGRTEDRRRVLINAIGPVWDGNEVWLVVAGGATFAAFPEWYATLFSGFYLPMLVILVALILRGVAFEYRGKRDDPRWRARWDATIFAGSLVPAVLWGVAFGNIVGGVPLDARHEFVGGLGDLLNPYALLGGASTLTLFIVHGACFLALKTDHDIRATAQRVTVAAGLPVAGLGAAFVTWTLIRAPGAVGTVLALAAALSLTVGLAASRAHRDGLAFTGTAAAIALVFVTLFVTLFPDVMPSTIAQQNSLTTTNAASSAYTLKIMSWVALAFTPLVLLYQGWTYWVFRKRLSTRDVANAPAH